MKQAIHLRYDRLNYNGHMRRRDFGKGLHMPGHPDDPGSLQSYAFGYGYNKALLQAVNSEVQA